MTNGSNESGRNTFARFAICHSSFVISILRFARHKIGPMFFHFAQNRIFPTDRLLLFTETDEEKVGGVGLQLFAEPMRISQALANGS